MYSLHFFFSSRKVYEKAKEQLEKGRHWFKNTVSRLVGKDCQRDWSHIGIVCFPNIENKEFFRNNQIESDEEMLKVVLIYD